MVDEKRFFDARERVLLEEEISHGFSIYKERAVHKTVKLYIEPDISRHEVEMSGMVLDIFNDSGVTEVQTGHFAPLIPKLGRLLPMHRVTLVHPLSVHTAHRWVNRESGEITQPGRRGTGKGIYSLGFDLYTSRDFLLNPNFSIHILFIECEEFRALDGRGRDKKRGATLIERLPSRLVGELWLREREDYRIFLPEGLPAEFSAKDYLKRIKSRSRYDRYCLKLLLFLGLVREVEKCGRATLYSVA